jgi:UDP-N-acetylmuramate dehydrogenase
LADRAIRLQPWIPVGNVGFSTKHTLALTKHGGGTAAELIALAKEISSGVHARFGVYLEPPPVAN